MPGGLQPKKAAKIAQRLIGVPQTQQDDIQRPRSNHPRSSNMNLAEVRADDQGVGDFVRGGVNGF